jgi:hypothetical protein
VEPVFQVGEKVAVNIGGCIENRSVGVVRSIRRMPELTTYEVDFADYRADARIEAFYVAELLTPVL